MSVRKEALRISDRSGTVWESKQPPKYIHPTRHWTDGDRWVTRDYLDMYRHPLKEW